MFKQDPIGMLAEKGTGIRVGGFSLLVSLAVIPGLAVLLTTGCFPLPHDAGKTLATVLKASGCQGCSPNDLREGEGEAEGEGEGEGEVEGEGEGEVPTTEEGEGEAPTEGEPVEAEPECALLDLYPGDGQVLVTWSCPNCDKISRFVLFRGSEIPPESKGSAVDGHAGEIPRAGDKSAYACEQVYSGVETSFIDKGLTNGQEYLYTLRGYDAAETVICRGYEAGVPTEQ